MKAPNPTTATTCPPAIGIITALLHGALGTTMTKVSELFGWLAQHHQALSLSQFSANDQEQTPNHPGGGKPYPANSKSGTCDSQCDCGKVNPCGA